MSQLKDQTLQVLQISLDEFLFFTLLIHLFDNYIKILIFFSIIINLE